MAPHSQGLEPPINPVRFTAHDGIPPSGYNAEHFAYDTYWNKDFPVTDQWVEIEHFLQEAAWRCVFDEHFDKRGWTKELGHEEWEKLQPQLQKASEIEAASVIASGRKLWNAYQAHLEENRS